MANLRYVVNIVELSLHLLAVWLRGKFEHTRAEGLDGAVLGRVTVRGISKVIVVRGSDLFNEVTGGTSVDVELCSSVHNC